MTVVVEPSDSGTWTILYSPLDAGYDPEYRPVAELEFTESGGVRINTPRNAS